MLPADGTRRLYSCSVSANAPSHHTPLPLNPPPIPPPAVRADIATRGEKSAGWGTVAFTTSAEAEKAIREFHRALVNDREISVRLYTTSGPPA